MFAGFSQAAEPYIIGYPADITGPLKHNYAPQAEGFRLYMQALNDKGGVNGHPVKVIYEDDKTQPARAGAIATKMILEDKVLAICGLGFSVVHKPIYKLAKEHGVPVVVAYSCVAPAWAPVENDMREIFAAGSIFHPKCIISVIGYALNMGKIFPKATFASTSYTSPGGRLTTLSVKNYLEKEGLKCIYHEGIPPGTVDVTPWAQKMAKANPEVICLNFGGEISVPSMAALEKYGYKGAIVLPDFMTEGDVRKAINGLMKPPTKLYQSGAIESPVADTVVPAHQEMRTAMKKYGHKYPPSMNHGLGWIVGIIMENALKKAGWPATPSSLLDALEKTNVDTKGLTPGPIIFTPTDHCGPKYSKMYKYDPDKKSFVTVSDWVTYNSRKLCETGEYSVK
jgi:ABC-type branched-subunit amino acid transport system substrate-binding protein